MTEQKETTEQTEIGQLNDKDIDMFIIEKRNRKEANFLLWNNKPLIRWSNIYYERIFCYTFLYFRSNIFKVQSKVMRRYPRTKLPERKMLITSLNYDSLH